METKRIAAGLLVGSGLVMPSAATAEPIAIGDPSTPVEVVVDAKPNQHSVRARARVRVGDVEVGPVRADVAPRVARPGDDPPAEQSSGDPGDAQMHVAPANVSVRPRVLSPGDDGDRRQRNRAPSQAAPVNADVSPRVLSEGDSGDREQRNGSAEPAAAEDQPAPPPETPPGPAPVPVVATLVERLRPRPGRRGALDLLGVNADVSPRLLSDGGDGGRSQRNGYDGAGSANDELVQDNQVGAVNLIVAPDVLSDGADGDVSQWNGSHDPQSATALGDDARTGEGDQVLTDNQVGAVNAAVLSDVAGDGADGGVAQHNGSDDDQSAHVVNTGTGGGDASTGSGDQTLTDDQIAVANLLIGGSAAGAGDGGDTTQHNGSDDDETATAQNGAGSDGDAAAGEGDQTLADLQVLPVNLALAPALASDGDRGSVAQHNGSDDDQEARVTNEGPAGGDGAAGAGDQALADEAALPAAVAADQRIGGDGRDGAATQQNGSDDDQLVVVVNGPGGGGEGGAATGGQTLTDGALVRVAAPASDLGTTDDVRVVVSNAPAGGAVMAEQDRSPAPGGGAGDPSPSEGTGDVGGPAGGESLRVLGARASGLPETGADLLPLTLLGLLSAALGLSGRRKAGSAGGD